jgi:predicted ATPase
MFRIELDLIRNRILEKVSDRGRKIDPLDIINSYYSRYAMPVERDVDFIRDLENVVKNDSSISQSNQDILESFNEILGGEYKADKEGLNYKPFSKNSKSNVKLSMGESASSVRSLLNLGIYIRHIARPGDFLMIDEPELNLHPMNQRQIARVLAKLVNANIRVFITTHSDYILKEFNTLIMLNNSKPLSEQVMKKYNYQQNELLDASRINAYIAKRSLVKVIDSSRRQMHNTFIKAPIDENGIEIMEFDETINVMNEIQDKLIFGDSEI